MRKLKPRDVFIMAYLALQLAIPMSYYLGRENRFDPRFAWRMLLDTGLIHCTTHFQQDGRSVAVERFISPMWASFMYTGKVEVAHAAGRVLCQRTPGSAVTVDMVCKDFDGVDVPMTDKAQNVCSGG